jgi:hypothetical protein
MGQPSSRTVLDEIHELTSRNERISRDEFHRALNRAYQVIPRPPAEIDRAEAVHLEVTPSTLARWRANQGCPLWRKRQQVLQHFWKRIYMEWAGPPWRPKRRS